MLIHKIIFYTTGHNGDIHYSREFIKDIIKKIPNLAFEFVIEARIVPGVSLYDIS